MKGLRRRPVKKASISRLLYSAIQTLPAAFVILFLRERKKENQVFHQNIGVGSVPLLMKLITSCCGPQGHT
jgi:hypothetical protein